MSLRNKLRFVGLSDTGKVREHNEDTIAHDADIGLLVLADGMGGYNAGEVASGIAVKTIVNLVKEHVEREDLSIADAESGLSRPNIILRDAISRANKIIYQTAHTQAQCEGMGTTVVAALFFDNKVTIAHVGDSRAYCLREGELLRLTDDHSLVDELIRQGKLTPEEAEEHPQRSVITRALGHELEIVSMPWEFATPARPMIEQAWTTHRVLDLTKLKTQLGYKDVVAPERGLELTAHWLRAHPLDPNSGEAKILQDPFDYRAEDELIAAWKNLYAQMPKVKFAREPGYTAAYSGPGGKARSTPMN